MRERRRILMGVVMGAHGIKGEVKVKSFAARGLDIAAYGAIEDEAGRARRVLDVRATSAADVVIARLEGVDDREQARVLKGTRLYIARDSLPEIAERGTFYAADLLGLVVKNAGGANLGRVVNVADFGAGAVLEIDGGPDGGFAVPFADRFVPIVDLEQGMLILDLDPEFFRPSEPETRQARAREVKS